MQIVLSDAQYWQNFLPLTFNKPIAEMRCGIFTFAERWKKLLQKENITYITENFLQKKYPAPEKKESLIIVPNFLPTEKILLQIENLQFGEALVFENELVVAKINLENFNLDQIHKMTDLEDPPIFFKKHTDLFQFNKEAIDFDFQLVTKNRTSAPISKTNIILGDIENIFIEEGAEVECSTLNAKTGKIYIGKNAEVMEGCNLRGSIVLGESSKLNMGAKIYGSTTIGPVCKIGGEVNNLVVFGYSNKGHDGFVGNSVIGEWCNLGADTNSSNLKNNYALVKLWDYKEQKFQCTGMQFVGMVMGDYCKTAINTQLNTGTIIGIGANIFKSGFPPNLIQNFSWGGMKTDEKYNLNKMYETTEITMQRRKLSLSEEEKEILAHIHTNF